MNNNDRQLNHKRVDDEPKRYLVQNHHLLRSPVLTIGCGYGADELYPAQQGLEVLATDVDSERLEAVRRLAELKKIKTLRTQRLDILAQGADLGTFRSIYSSFLLHLFSPERLRTIFVPKIWELLSEGGVALIIYRLINPHRLDSRYSVLRSEDDQVQIHDKVKNFSFSRSIINKKRFLDLFGSYFVIEDIVEYTETRYNKLSEDMNSEIIASVLRRLDRPNYGVR